MWPCDYLIKSHHVVVSLCCSFSTQQICEVASLLCVKKSGSSEKTHARVCHARMGDAHTYSSVQAPYNMTADYKTCSRKSLQKATFFCLFTTLPLRPTFAESLTSSPNAGCPIASEESHSHTRYPPDVREREWEWDRGKLGERKKEGESEGESEEEGSE